MWVRACLPIWHEMWDTRGFGAFWHVSFKRTDVCALPSTIEFRIKSLQAVKPCHLVELFSIASSTRKSFVLKFSDKLSQISYCIELQHEVNKLYWYQNNKWYVSLKRPTWIYTRTYCQQCKTLTRAEMGSHGLLTYSFASGIMYISLFAQLTCAFKFDITTKMNVPIY